MALTFRRAIPSDLSAIVAMLADDDLGRTREGSADLPLYRDAFADIDADPNQLLCVAECEGEVVGTLQLTFISGLSRRGARRGQVEAVRVTRDRRSEGIGKAMIQWAIAQCRAHNCTLVQLTTDRSRADAHRFYESLGFEASHVGYKLEFGQRG